MSFSLVKASGKSYQRLDNLRAYFCKRLFREGPYECSGLRVRHRRRGRFPGETKPVTNHQTLRAPLEAPDAHSIPEPRRCQIRRFFPIPRA